EAGTYLVQQSFGDPGLLRPQFDVSKKLTGVFNGHRADFADIFTRYSYLPCLAHKPGPVAFRANGVSPVPAQKHPNVQPVLLSLEITKEPAHSWEFLVAVKNSRLLIWFEVCPCDVEWNAGLACESLHLGR